MRIVVDEKKIVMVLYFVALLSSMLIIVDNIPFAGLLLKVKYIYVVAIAFFYVKDGMYVWNKRFFFAFGLLFIHTFLYGVVFINPTIESISRAYFQQLSTFYLMTFFTILYVFKKNCYTEVLETSALALASMILWCSSTHSGDFVNPIYFVNIFSRTERFRAPFGMGDVNYCGNYCLYLLIVAVLLWNEWKEKKKYVDIRVRGALVFVCFAAIFMLLSTASRSAILSLTLFGSVLFVLRKKAVFLKYWKLITVIVGAVSLIAVVALIPTGVLEEIWVQSNREGNMSINYPLFVLHGNFLHGMGYMDNSGFLNMAYGYQTTAMDVYYLYIPFSTGIVGSILIFGQMIYMLYCLLRYTKIALLLLVLLYLFQLQSKDQLYI